MYNEIMKERRVKKLTQVLSLFRVKVAKIEMYEYSYYSYGKEWWKEP